MISGSTSYSVITEVAEKEGVSPTELSPPLFDVVDPELLDAFLQSPADSTAEEVEIEFTYLGYRVSASSTGAVSVQRNRPVRPDGGVADEDEFQEALADLVCEASANGIDVEGGWIGADGADQSEFGIEIYEVRRE